MNRPEVEHLWSAVRALALCVSLSGAALAQGKTAGPPAGEPGGPGLAIRCAKALVCPPDATETPGYTGWRLTVTKRPEGWLVTGFVQGD